MVPIRVIAAACVWAGMATLAPPAAADPIDANGLWALHRVGAPALSPDGRTAVAPVTRYNPETDKSDTDLYAFPTDGSPARRLTTDPAGESAPQWSPDGSVLAFVAKREGDTAPQIYLLPAAGGEALRLTEVPTGVSSPRWTPDGRSLVFVSRVWADLGDGEPQGARLRERAESHVTARTWDRAPIRWWDTWIDDRQGHLYQVNVADKSVRALTRETGLAVFVRSPGPEPFAISPDGSEIAFIADTDETGTAANLDVFALSMSDLTARNLTPDNPADDFDPVYSPDGRWMAFGRQTIEGFYGDKVRLMLRDRRSEGVREIAADWDRSATGLVWAQDSRSLYGAIDDAGVNRLYRIPIAGGSPRVMGSGSDVTALAIAARPQVLVGLEHGLSAPPRLVRIDPANGRRTVLSDPNAAAMAELDMGRVESVTYPGANGADIQMWVVYPPGFDPSARYPVLLLLHGGPHNAITDGWHWRWNAQVFAGWGYVVAWHNFHGSSGFGQDFTDAINPDRISLPYEDTIKATEWFAAQPWADTERMVAAGGSYGGFLASVLLGREHPFRALIAHAAVYNSYTQIAADYGAERDRFFQFWEDPDQFHAYSPHMSAGNFNTPTLVIHGEQDFRVPVNHGIELFNTLQTRGVPSRLVYYPNENHWVLNRANSLHWYGEFRDWITRYAPPGADAPAAPRWAPEPAASAGAP